MSHGMKTLEEISFLIDAAMEVAQFQSTKPYKELGFQTRFLFELSRAALLLHIFVKLPVFVIMQIRMYGWTYIGFENFAFLIGSSVTAS